MAKPSISQTLSAGLTIPFNNLNATLFHKNLPTSNNNNNTIFPPFFIG